MMNTPFESNLRLTQVVPDGPLLPLGIQGEGPVERHDCCFTLTELAQNHTSSCGDTYAPSEMHRQGSGAVGQRSSRTAERRTVSRESALAIEVQDGGRMNRRHRG